MRDAALESVAVGFFDGVHVGHRAILSRAARAFTFSNHPLSVLAPERAPTLVMTPESKVAAMRGCGVAEVEMVEFTAEIAALSPEEFATRHLARGGQSLPTVVCGENWRFGAGGRGDADLLRRMGFGVEVVPYAVYGGRPVSSSRIRRCLETGELSEANAMLGRAYSVVGEVARGKGLGARIGFPTVNMRLRAGFALPLPLGVYEVSACGVVGVANVGVAPTLGDAAWTEPVVEVHFAGLGKGALPSVAEGDKMEVSFARFIRPERKFASLDDLKRQIASDCCIVRDGLIRREATT